MSFLRFRVSLFQATLRVWGVAACNLLVLGFRCLTWKGLAVSPPTKSDICRLQSSGVSKAYPAFVFKVEDILYSTGARSTLQDLSRVLAHKLALLRAVRFLHLALCHALHYAPSPLVVAGCGMLHQFPFGL